jgi:pyruvate carboxylase subunit B
VKYTVTIGDRTVEIEVHGDTVRLNGDPIEARLIRIPRTPLRQLVLDGRARTFAMLPSDEGWEVYHRGESWPVAVVDERTRQLRELTGQEGKQKLGGVVKAPMPGLVLRVEVEVGQRVDAGGGVVVLEAMKMENEIKSPGGGVVKEIHVAAGEAVDKGAPLVEIGEEA